MDYKMIRKSVNRLGVDCFEGSIQSIIDMLEDFKKQYGNDVTLEYGQYNKYDDYYSYDLYIIRKETEKERTARKEEERTRDIINLERLRKEVERLEKVIK